MDAQHALEILIQGNLRFATGKSEFNPANLALKRDSLVGDQSPFAIILGCSDSRVPAEIVFDQGLGDLFVIRVAGNIVAPSQLGSVEFAAEQFGTSLVVVLGHTNCGAVEATLKHLSCKVDSRSENINSIVRQISPVVEHLVDQQDAINSKAHQAVFQQAIRANIDAQVSKLKHGSKFLAERIANNKIRIVGAEYSLETGKVEFFLKSAGFSHAIK